MRLGVLLTGAHAGSLLPRCNVVTAELIDFRGFRRGRGVELLTVPVRHVLLNGVLNLLVNGSSGAVQSDLANNGSGGGMSQD